MRSCGRNSSTSISEGLQEIREKPGYGVLIGSVAGIDSTLSQQSLPLAAGIGAGSGLASMRFSNCIVFPPPGQVQLHKMLAPTVTPDQFLVHMLFSGVSSGAELHRPRGGQTGVGVVEHVFVMGDAWA